MHFVKAHAYGNDFLFVEEDAIEHFVLGPLARELCDRQTGIGADGLIAFRRTETGARMRLANADGSHAEVSGNGVRALGALLVREEDRRFAATGGAPLPTTLTIETAAGPKRLTRTARGTSKQTFRAFMGTPQGLHEVPIMAAGEPLQVIVLNIGNPQCVILGPLPDPTQFRRLGAAVESHELFPDRTNVEFVNIETATRLRILIWERGVGPTTSSGTGSCAALVAAAAYGGSAREAEVIAPGGAQHVEWTDEGVYLTGWAEVICEGEWLRPLPGDHHG